MKKIIFFVAFCLSLSVTAEQKNGIVYVKPGATGTGASWADAMGDIQAALTAAKVNSAARKDVWVATGEFVITTAISIQDSVNIYGSFAGTETLVSQRAKVANGKAWEFTNPTTLKGSGARLVQAGGNLDMETVVDGFIMRDGNGIGSSLSASGGAVVVRGNVVFQNCIMRNNTASVTGAGGAAIMTGGIIRHCLIENNTQSGGSNGGGGIFSNPAAGFPVLIEYSEIRSNSSTIRGAGLGIQGVEMTYLSNVKIYNNVAMDGATTKPGAAIYTNSAKNRTTNSLIYNNTGSNAIYLNGGDLLNNTIVKNVGGLYGATNAINMTNNIVWGCFTDASASTATSITGAANTTSTVHNNATYNPVPTDKSWILADNVQFSSNISNGDVTDPAAGTLGSGPKFVKVSSFVGAATTAEQQLNLDSVNWSLNGNSPLVNIGKTMTVVSQDYTGLSRPQGYPIETARFDIGAYELPYYTVVAGEPAIAHGAIYSALGILLPENSSHGYAKGDKIELFFQPNNGYTIDRAYYTVSTDGGATFTGSETDITAQISSEGFWIGTVHAPFKVSVVWKSLTALKQLDTEKVKCMVIYNGVQLSGLNTGDNVSVYNSNGMLMHKSVATSNQTNIVLAKGVYILRVADSAKKLIIK